MYTSLRVTQQGVLKVVQCLELRFESQTTDVDDNAFAEFIVATFLLIAGYVVVGVLLVFLDSRM